VLYDSGEGEYYELGSDPWQLGNRYASMRPALKAAMTARTRTLSDAAGAALRRAEEAAVEA
jgi:hypothetical protein